MSSVEDPVVESLRSRLVGSGNFHSGIHSLDTALTLQSRIHDHLFGIGLDPTVAKVLSDDCKKLLGNFKVEPGNQDINIRNLLNKILYNCEGVLHYHMERPNDANIYFSKSKVIELRDLPFAQFLNLENLYYRGLCKDDTLLYGEELFRIIDSVPNDSQGLTLHYLSMIFNHISRDKEVAGRILATFPSSSPLTCLASLHLGEYEDTKFLNILAQLVNESHFPQAEANNNKALEDFHMFLHYYFKKATKLSPDWKKYIIESMEKTFQSVAVAKSAFIYFGRNSITSPVDTKESILNFVNFVKYTQREYVLHGNKHDDLVSLIDSYAYILKIAQDSSHDVENVFNFQDSVNKLLDLLRLMHKQNGFPLMSGQDSLNWLENRDELILPRTVSKRLTNAWEMLFTIDKNSLTLLNDNSLTAYLTNALSVATDPLKLYQLNFQYCYLLAQKGLIEPAIKILETVLLEENPECYSAWHLLALCKSINEDKEVSFKIVCSVLQAMQEGFEEGRLAVTDRWQFVHLKMTQLKIVEDIFGIMDALEMLPELFELFSLLFPADDKRFDRIGNGYNQTKEYLLQIVWLFASGLYMRVPENYTDAADAINESIGVSKEFKNLNCNIAKGYLCLARGQCKRASKEFNTVLLADPYNVSALVGLAQVVYPEGDTEICDYYKLRPLTPDSLDQKQDCQPESVFVSEADRSANIARLKLLLESAIAHSIEADHSPEIWWYLSLIYEQYKDIGYKDALLNCVRYKETEPVRPFKYCNF
ncbi:hypothetical protein ZYGR_0AD02490 [Zygosaccharomyces rouxii]|uniref:Cargo-transport protein YPP1 n=2 Tax=Zygosaccharomyces rouxii TaxID=4956 RepID=C5E0D2_ZYGRC|nr:uncharacterized protein ZYRO0G11748g [Zygosaccharomyces rouxii]KAH9202559.1 hypothetical protein LQ764DRAFT_26789 [Zygosaccharomyces rouxii]GAV51066.1 hypothetical protein ZYGR_0AD02490 [Zygosaccharomyces rouxii]CAR29566.1 ZYRO0G11748p [Zygosaccharomyces rouxii]